jgi:hypothetical protein
MERNGGLSCVAFPRETAASYATKISKVTARPTDALGFESPRNPPPGGFSARRILALAASIDLRPLQRFEAGSENMAMRTHRAIEKFLTESMPGFAAIEEIWPT